jgi:hypothetical protein
MTESSLLTIPFVFNGTAVHLEVDKQVEKFPKEASASDSRIHLTWDRTNIDTGGQSQLFVGMLIQGEAVASIFANSPQTETQRSLGTQLIHFSPLASPDQELQVESADVYLSPIVNRPVDLQCGIFRIQQGKPQWVEQVCTPSWQHQLIVEQSQLLQCHCLGSRLRMELDLGYGGLFKNDPLYTTTTTTTSTTTTTTTGPKLSTALSTEQQTSSSSSSSTTTMQSNFTTTVNSDTSTSSDLCSFTFSQTPYTFSLSLVVVSLLALIVAMVIHKVVLGPR